MRFAFFIVFVGCLSTACVRNDEKIERRVEKRIQAADPSIETSSRNGVVSVEGTVENEAVNAKIANETRKVAGVKGVLLNTKVEDGRLRENKPDKDIQKFIQTALNERYITGVKVKVENGVATLSGEAKRSDLRNISFIADGSGAKKVINKLDLR